MLILSRKVDEQIKIGDNITITIIEVRGDQVKVGIEAPKSVKVFREVQSDSKRKQSRFFSRHRCARIDIGTFERAVSALREAAQKLGRSIYTASLQSEVAGECVVKYKNEL